MGSGLLSPLHIVILLVIVLLVFGAKRLPELGRGLGSGMKEFKDSVTGHEPTETERPAVTPAVEHVPPVVTTPVVTAPVVAPAVEHVPPVATTPPAEPHSAATPGSAERDQQSTSAARPD